YDALRLGGDYQQRLYNQASMQISYSLSRGLGGRDSSDAQMSNVPLSRQEANPEFTKLAGSIRVSQPLYNDIRLEIIGLGQTAFNRALFRAEQFSLDGKDSLSPFPSGTLISDQGTTLRAEFSNRYTVNFGERHLLTTPYLFIAGGWGRNNAPTAAENETLHAHAWGLGVRNNMISRHKFPVSLGLEIGEGISSENNFKHLWRGMFSLFLSY
ncbi:MAG: ShlB/FhaC/HecB family hemolysin secretion/activation protein, partial [Methylophilaceae bacterium]